MKIKILPSDKGDCLLIEGKDGTTILADGGIRESYIQYVRKFMGEWAQKNKRPLDLVYVSHIDQDHIAGVLQLMDDLVDWRVFKFREDAGEPARRPAFAKPPEVRHIWHNSFHDMVGKNAGEIGSMLAARAAMLSTSSTPAARLLSVKYGAIAASIPEAIKLSRRISPQQLQIPLNEAFDGKLAQVRKSRQVVHLREGSSLSITVIGPFDKDLDALRDSWNAWLRDAKHKDDLRRLRNWRDREDARFDVAETFQFALDDELGDRNKVSEANLASLMLLLEEDGRRVLLTGDGHQDDVLEGLRHYMVLNNGGGIHVDVLKVQHHGSEHNWSSDFARRVTADHYVICGNGMHENPDLRVLNSLLDSRLGSGEQRSANPQVDQPFQIWFNCSTALLDEEIQRRRDANQRTKTYEAARDHMSEVTQLMRDRAHARLKCHFLEEGLHEIRLGQ